MPRQKGERTAAARLLAVLNTALDICMIDNYLTIFYCFNCTVYRTRASNETARWACIVSWFECGTERLPCSYRIEFNRNNTFGLIYVSIQFETKADLDCVILTVSLKNTHESSAFSSAETAIPDVQT
jgi:hypothetical protein